MICRTVESLPSSNDFILIMETVDKINAIFQATVTSFPYFPETIRQILNFLDFGGGGGGLSGVMQKEIICFFPPVDVDFAKALFFVHSTSV